MQAAVQVSAGRHAAAPFTLIQVKAATAASIQSSGVKSAKPFAVRLVNGKARRLISIDLWEISLVTFPMLEGARVRDVKSAARALADSLFVKSPNPDGVT